jgi:hypothetical protein
MPEPAPAAPGNAAPAFLTELARVLNAGVSRSVVLAGHVHDLYPSRQRYVPLTDAIVERFADVPGLTLLVYELNGPLRLRHAGGAAAGWDALRKAWIAWKLGSDADTLTLATLTDRVAAKQRDIVAAEFDRQVVDVVGQPTLALEFLRQLTLMSRSVAPNHQRYLPGALLMVVEAADLLIPAGNGDISSLNAADRHRVSIATDWFADPGFMDGPDSIVLLAESAALLHPRVAKLPQVVTLTLDAPGEAARHAYITHFTRDDTGSPRMKSVGFDDASIAVLARQTAGLSLHALRQLLLSAAHRGALPTPGDVTTQVERYLTAQLGDDVIEFKRPTHTLGQVIGAGKLVSFIRDELIPRFQSTGEDALPGAAVAGPIGGGKTFIFEAVAAELGVPVLTLKNIRSQWFGQTDVIFERLRRVLGSLGKVLIFVDEADTQFGGVGEGAHETERRLTGKVQQMMSDPALRGKVTWLLMTARIERLSPDIRRPGRVGDLIVPVLDPPAGSADHLAFVKWALKPALGAVDDERARALADTLHTTSAAGFAALRSAFKAAAARCGRLLTEDEARAVAEDHLPADIEATRRYQTLQALLNCTRRSLLPDPANAEADRRRWAIELASLHG